jgi:hypothetical protein
MINRKRGQAILIQPFRRLVRRAARIARRAFVIRDPRFPGSRNRSKAALDMPNLTHDQIGTQVALIEAPRGTA